MSPRQQRGEAWASEIVNHRQALADFLTAAAAVPASAWNAPRAAGKWSPAEVAEHVRLTYVSVLGDVTGGAGIRPRGSWLRRTVLRAFVMPWMLRTRRFPKGAPAVREIRPAGGPYEQAAVIAGVRAAGEGFLAELARLDPKRSRGVTHPFFGRIEPLQGLRLITLHTEHHRAQLAGGAA